MLTLGHKKTRMDRVSASSELGVSFKALFNAES